MKIKFESARYCKIKWMEMAHVNTVPKGTLASSKPSSSWSLLLVVGNEDVKVADWFVGPPQPAFLSLGVEPTKNSPELYHKPMLHSPEICKHLVMWTPRGPFISPCCKYCGGVIYEITECWPDFHKYSTKRGVRKFQACPKQGWLMGGAAADVEQIFDTYEFHLIDQLISYKCS